MRAYTNKKHEKKTLKNYFSTNNDDYSKEILETKTIAEMRTLAKHRQINLKGQKKKPNNKHSFRPFFKGGQPVRELFAVRDLGYI